MLPAGLTAKTLQLCAAGPGGAAIPVPTPYAIALKTGATFSALALCAAAIFTVAAPQPAYASDWGCRVVLCLATPGSPTKYAECVPPITKLWNVLATGGSFPTCTGVGINTKKVKHGYDMTVTQSDGGTSQYALDTAYQTVTQR